MAISYDVANNLITVTGYTESVPYNFTDLWNADKAGNLQLLSPASAGPDLSLTRQVRPTDKVSLKLSIVITNFSVEGVVTLTGKDKDDNAQTEDINITGNGTYITTKWFKSIDAGGVDCTGTYTIEIRQSQWGVVWKTGDVQFMFDCKLRIGDDQTLTVFADEDKEIVMSAASVTEGSVICFDVRANAEFRLGKLLDEATKAVAHGVSVISLANVWHYLIHANNVGKVYLYGSSFSLLVHWRCGISHLHNDSRLWHNIFSRVLAEGQLGDVYDLRISRCANWAFESPKPTSLENVIVNYCYYTIMVTSGISITVKNIIARKILGHFFRFYNPNDLDQYVINGDSDNWKILFPEITSTGKLYRQYEVDLTVVDSDGVPINGATVTLYDKNNNKVFQVQTNIDGKIPTQTVTYGWYEQATGDTLNPCGPFRLLVRSDKIDEELWGIPLDEKTKLRIDPKGVTSLALVDLAASSGKLDLYAQKKWEVELT